MMFSDSEVRSRVWTDTQGKELKLIDLLTFPVANNPDLLIARYGISGTNPAFCLDFYENLPVVSGVKKSLVFSAHDYENAPVTRITTSDERTGVVIHVCRQFISTNATKIYEKSYDYSYNSNGIQQGLGDLINEIQHLKYLHHPSRVVRPG
jgi:hypothetical protein